MIYFQIALIVLTIIFQSVDSERLPVRQTSNGPVEGTIKISSLGKKYYAFLGIPYAEVPITGIDPYSGEQVDRRFKAPEPLKRKWTKNLRAHEAGTSCPQTPGFRSIVTAEGDENCLSINVYVPVGGVEKKTVLLYIFGGMFAGGSANVSVYGPDFLIDLDNIVVTFEYRNGIFGFLNLGFGDYTGNMSLKDQLLAMKWVHENIENFSGNKDEVLLFGVSTGSVSVNWHMLNEESRKYFNRAYIMSGVVFNYDHLLERNHIAIVENCTEIKNNTEALIKYLKTADPNILTRCANVSHSVVWAPTIESSQTQGAFITKNPIELYNSNDAPVIDTLFGFNSEEAMFLNPEWSQSSEPILGINLNDTELLLPFDGLNRQNYPNEYNQALALLRDEYFPKNLDTNAIKHANVQLMTDLYFNYKVLKTFLLQVKANNNNRDKNMHKNTFLFRFSVDDDLNVFKRLYEVNSSGTSHGDDVCYTFNCHSEDKVYEKHLQILQRNGNDTVYNVIRRMTKMVTNFARYGDPSTDNDTPFTPCTSPEHIFCQEISNNPKSSISTDIKEQLHFGVWEKIGEIYENLKTTPNSSKSVFSSSEA